MNISFYEIQPHEQRYFQQQLSSDILTFDAYELTPERAPETSNAEIVSVFVCSQITAEVLDRFPHLKLLITRSTGYDHIDLEAARKRNIVVCNAPTYAAVTVAEYTFALLLALSRMICKAAYRIEHEHSFSLENLRGFDLAGKTIGIIGTGRIGKLVAQRARAFDMNILACDIYPDTQFAQKVGCTYLPFKAILPQADILTFHTELTPATYHMLNTDMLSSLKQGVYIINTARGAVIETQALVSGLKNGTIAGAALDVLEDECGLKEHFCSLQKNVAPEKTLSDSTRANDFLIHHANVLVTPHNAFNTNESRERLTEYTVTTITKWKAGQAVESITL